MRFLKILVAGSLLLATAAACERSRPSGAKAPASYREATEKARPPRPRGPNELPRDIGVRFEVRTQTWLCKRQTDVKLTNRERTPEDQPFFDKRLARGLVIPLDPGTRLHRVLGQRALRYLGRIYLKVILDSGESKGERGLVARDTLTKIR